MTGEGFKNIPHEASDKAADESEAKSKSGKKVDTKKEAVVGRGKDIWGKIVGEPKSEEAEKIPSDDELANSESAEESELDSTSVEDESDPALEVLTDEEEAAVSRMYAEARLAELEAGRSEDEDPAEAAAREADIEFLQTMLADSEVAELEAEDGQDEIIDELTAEPPEAQVAVSEVPEARPFEPDEAVDLNASVRRPVPPENTRQARPVASTPVPPRPGIPRASGEYYDRTPAVESPQATHVEYHSSERRDPKMGYLLLGGAIGYLIGRRRGRIKTEKQLAVVQKKLERQVEAVQQKVVQQEYAVQKLARQNHQLRQEAHPNRQPSPANIGHSERHEPSRPVERPARPVNETFQRPSSPRVESLNREQLLEASSKVRFGETNLRRVYEAQLVDETGLRRLMHEAEAGHDLRRALAREFLVKELRFERDPRLKGNDPDNGAPSGGGTDFAGAAVPAAAQSTNQPSPSTPAAPAANLPAASRNRRQTDVSPAALIALTIFTLALAIYAIWLTITR